MLLNTKVNNNKTKIQKIVKYDAIQRKLIVGGRILGVLTRFPDPSFLGSYENILIGFLINA